VKLIYGGFPEAKNSNMLKMMGPTKPLIMLT